MKSVVHDAIVIPHHEYREFPMEALKMIVLNLLLDIDFKRGKQWKIRICQPRTAFHDHFPSFPPCAQETLLFLAQQEIIPYFMFLKKKNISKELRLKARGIKCAKKPKGTSQ